MINFGSETTTDSSYFFFQASLLVVAIAAQGAEDTPSWNLKISDPNRAGKFLNVPIYYGDWVPITKAKAQIDSLVAGFDVSSRREDGTDGVSENFNSNNPFINTAPIVEPDQDAVLQPEQKVTFK